LRQNHCLPVLGRPETGGSPQQEVGGGELPNARIEDPRFAWAGRFAQRGVETLLNDTLQSLRALGIDAGLAEMPDHQPAGVLGHVCRAGDPDLHPSRRKIFLWSPGGGIRARAGIDDHPATRRDREHRSQRGAPYRRQRTELAEIHAHRQAVGRDPVAGAHGPEQSGDDDQPAVGAPSGGRIQRREVQCVIQNAGVELGDRHGRRRSQPHVVGDVRAEVGANSQQRRGIGVRAYLGESGGHPGTCRGKLGEGDALGVGGLAPWASGLGLRGRQQDQHLPERRGRPRL
jgi:hypothetical protein